MHHLFISYSRKDKAFVERLAKALNDQGRTTWVDWGIPPMAEFMDEIRNAIEGAASFVFVLSPDSVASDPCRQEIEHAVLHHKRLIPIVCRNVKASEAHKALAPINWISFEGAATFEAPLELLTTAIETDLAWVRAHTELETRAIGWKNGGRSRSALLRGEELTTAEQEMVRSTEGRQPQPTPWQREFVLEGRRDASRRLRVVIGAVTLALVATIVLAVVAVVQRRLAEQRARIADSRRLATEAVEQVDLDLSMLLSIEAFRAYPTLEAKKALLGSLQHSPYLHRFLWGHTGPVLSVAYHPNGRLLVSGGENEMIVWDLATGKPARPPLPQRYVQDLQFSPDGKILAGRKPWRTWEDPETLSFFWETRTWKQIGPQVQGDFKGFAPDGHALILQGFELRQLDVIAQRWSAPPVKILGRDIYLQPEEFALSADGSWLADTLIGHGLKLWNLATGERREPPGGIPKFREVRLFDPQGRFILYSDFEGGISFLDVKSLKPSGDAIKAQKDDVLAVSPDGTVIAVGGADQRIRLWAVDPRQQIGGDFSAHRGEIRGLAFSPNGRSVASAGADGAVLLWDVITPQPPDEPLGAHQILGGIYHFGFSDVANEFEEGGTDAITVDAAATTLLFSQDASVLVVDSGGGSVDIWSVAQRRWMASLRLFTGWLGSLALSPDGTVLAAAGGEKGDASDRASVVVVAVPSGRHLAQPLYGQKNFGKALTFSPDGRTLVVAGKDELLFFDVQAGRPLASAVRSGLREISALAYRPDGSGLILSGTTEAYGTPVTELWEPGERKRVRTLQKKRFPALAFSPDSELLATSETGDSVTVYDAMSLASRTLPFQTNFYKATMSFSADSQLLAIAGDPGVHLRDAGNGQELGSPLAIPTIPIASGAMAEPVGAVAFTRDGKVLLSAYPVSKTLVHWDLDPESWIRRICGIVRRNLSPIELKQYLGDDAPHLTCGPEFRIGRPDQINLDI